ncbi:MAG: DinB family protein [Anaerolineae bacterium]
MSDSADLSRMTVSEFLEKLDAAWAELQAFIASLTPEKLTGPTDAAGWTVKDHLMHIVVWEDGGVNALLDGESPHTRMGIDEATWTGRDFEVINAAVQQHSREMSLSDVLDALNHSHVECRRHIAAMSNADLQRPYRDFFPVSESANPIVWWLEGNSTGHYEEHLPWMRAIVENA